MKIFSVALSPHDHNTYDGVFHNQRERHTRLKHNIPWHFNSYPHHSEQDKMNQDDNSAGIQFYDEYFKPQDHELLAFTTTIGGMKQIPHADINEEFLNFTPSYLWDYMRHGNQYYIDHHQSHAAYAYLTSGYKESDILAIDGRGWKFNCIFVDKHGKITDLSAKANIGKMWNYWAKALDMGYLGAGKVMGLAAYGQRNYDENIHMILEQMFETDFEQTVVKIASILPTQVPIRWIAYTLQMVTQQRIEDFVYELQTSKNLCVSGGVAYNGYMNEEFYKKYDHVYVPPAPGDEGQSLGTYMHADYTLNNNIHIPDVYAGKEYDFVGDEKVDIKEVAQAIADGKIIGWFQGKSESGNRALGNRSILADPRNPNIKNIINTTIKMREDFRPFAPSVLEEHYKEWFDTKEPSPYMSRIVKVKRDDIPGVTHVDDTARIQTVNREQNQKFYDLINEFYKITGIPMLVNTSFNCQEPIVETPEEAINTFNKTGMDILVINDYIMRKMG
jgi:carbamoyltransferase